MFNPINFIDTVQGAKKTVVNTFVFDKSYKDSLNKIIDAQTSYAKSQVELGETVLKNATEFVKNYSPVAKKTKEAA